MIKDSVSHFSIYGSIYNEPTMKGVRKPLKMLSKEHSFKNPRYSYLTVNSKINNSNLTNPNKGE